MPKKPKLPRDKSFLSKKKYDRVNQEHLNKSLKEGKQYGFISKTNTLKSPSGMQIKKGSAINTNIKKTTVSSPGLPQTKVSFGQPTVERKSIIRFRSGDLQGKPVFRSTTPELGKSLGEFKPKTDARISAQKTMMGKNAQGLTKSDVQQVKSGYDAPLKSGGTKKEYFGSTEVEKQDKVKSNMSVSFLKTSTPKTALVKKVTVTPPPAPGKVRSSSGSGTDKTNPVPWIKKAKNKKALSVKKVPLKIRYK
jgi:hypothetical protein